MFDIALGHAQTTFPVLMYFFESSLSHTLPCASVVVSPPTFSRIGTIAASNASTAWNVRCARNKAVQVSAAAEYKCTYDRRLIVQRTLELMCSSFESLFEPILHPTNFLSIRLDGRRLLARVVVHCSRSLSRQCPIT